jgi:hypothetical protein
MAASSRRLCEFEHRCGPEFMLRTATSPLLAKDLPDNCKVFGVKVCHEEATERLAISALSRTYGQHNAPVVLIPGETVSVIYLMGKLGGKHSCSGSGKEGIPVRMTESLAHHRLI